MHREEAFPFQLGGDFATTQPNAQDRTKTKTEIDSIPRMQPKSVPTEKSMQR